MIIYYNPDCSKCQEAAALLTANNCSFEIRNYLQQPPTLNELKELTHLLQCGPLAIARQKETLFLELTAGKQLNDDFVFDLLCRYPILIERPIVIDGRQAVIGRPPVLVLSLIEKNSEG